MTAVQAAEPDTAAHRDDGFDADLARAGLYRLLAHLLNGPPDDAALSATSQLAGDGSPLGHAVVALATAATAAKSAELGEVYQQLFIGLGRGELIPYGSYYMTGFLHEKPLARLRADMEQLGLARSAGTCEPEDHISSVLELMAGLIDGGHGVPVSIARQRTFFEAHLAPWATHFFTDLEQSRAASFYTALGSVGRLFMAIEAQAFEMD